MFAKQRTFKNSLKNAIVSDPNGVVYQYQPQEQQAKMEPNPEKEGDSDKKKQPPPKPKPGQISPEQVKSLLEAMNNQEKGVQEKVNVQKVKGVPVKTKKDW